jgi:hypothetical protein
MQQITPTPNYTALHAHGPRPSARARENAVKNGNPFPETAFLCSSISQTGFRSRARRFAAILILAVIPGCSSAAAASAHADCEVAQSVFEADMQFLKQRPPTHLRLMPTRYVDLRRAARGLACSGVPLVAFDGLHYGPAAWYDDPGLYFFVPELARVFGVSLVTATDVLLIGVVFLASSFGLLGLLRTVHTKLGRRIGVVAFLLLTVVMLIAGDVYIMNAAPAIACVPWILSFVSSRKLTIGMLITLAMTGALGETANFVRSHAGTGLVLFALVVAVGIHHVRLASRIIVVVTLLLGVAGAALVFRHVYAQRDAFLQHQPGALMESARGHVFWHAIYLGLSYVKNSEVPEFRDEFAFAKVRALRPEVTDYSPEYEQVLKWETFKLAKRRPFLILANLFVKLVVVSLFCVFAANVGLYGAKLAPKPVWLELAFLVAIAFNGLYGILVLPNPKYLVGLIAFAGLYGVYSIEYAAGHLNLKSRLRWIEKLVFIRSRQEPVVVPS